MPQSASKPAPRSVLDIPTPYAVCVNCGATPALEDPTGTGEALCPACSVSRLRERAAAAHLRDLIASALGVWGNFWAAAGVPHRELLDLLESEGDGWMNPDAAARFRRVALATSRRSHRPEPYRDHVPERHALTAERLPEVVRMVPVSGSRRPYFEQQNPATGERSQYQGAPGLDLLSLTLADGSAVLLPLGIDGRLNLERGRLSGPVRVPAELLPAVLSDWRTREERNAEGEA